MKEISLNGIWEGECVGKFKFDGNIPGCTIQDLVDHGTLPSNLLEGNNAVLAMENEERDWIYKKRFFCEDVGDRSRLNFERLDTYADVYLNGIHLGYRENGNIAQSFEISQVLKPGENLLEVRLYSPITRVKGMNAGEGAFCTERLNTRRVQCTYGWDWAARFLTCGIGNVSLTIYRQSDILLSGVYVYTKYVDDDGAAIGIDLSVCAPYKGRVLSLEIFTPEGELERRIEKYCDDELIRFSVDIPSPRLWYPLGYGEQPLYELSIKDSDQEIYREKFGIRLLRILQELDKKGSANYLKCLSVKNQEYDKNTEFSGFIVKVNGMKIMCKGANWVPCQPYEMPDKHKKMTQTLELAREMGLNIIRVWGGGAFECKHFYDECSRLGFLVVQDFLMACGEYPEKEEWFIDHLKAETEYAAKFLRNQPCLAWWNGDNENGVRGSDTDEDYRGRRAIHEGIQGVLYRLDPYRDFFASSPYGGTMYASNTVGTTHNTQFMSELFQYIEGKAILFDYKEELKKYRARFISEEPVFGAASLSSLRKFMTEEEIFGENLSMWLCHTKGNPCLSKELMYYAMTFAEKVLGTFENGYDRLFKYEYIQYEWLRIVMEQARREKWFCSGIIFWMLNDIWTAASGWSLIDYFNKPKLAYYSFKRCAKPILGTIDCEGERYKLNIVNDSNRDVDCRVCLYKASYDRQWKLCEEVVNVKGGENVVLNIEHPLGENEIFIADILSELNNDRAFYKQGDLTICPKKNTLIWEADVERMVIKLKAETYIHVVNLGGEAIFEDNGFSLCAGEERELSFRYLENATDKKIMAESYTLSCLIKK